MSYITGDHPLSLRKICLSARLAVRLRKRKAASASIRRPNIFPHRARHQLDVTHAPGWPEAFSFKSGGDGGLIVHGVITRLCLVWRDISDRLQQSAVIEPVAPNLFQD